MIRKNSDEWYKLIRKLERSKQKSNRDVFCLHCWRIYNYEGNIRHKDLMPSHKTSIVTSKSFASEDLFIQLAKAMNKVVVREKEEYIENPY